LLRNALVGAVVCVSVFVSNVPSAGAKTRLPDACKLVTQSDVQTVYGKLEPALVPTSVGIPTQSKPREQGGFGLQDCETSLQFPNSVGGSVLVSSLKASSFCPAKGQPGKKVTVQHTKALLEPVPGKPNVVRDVTFAKGGACITIETFLSGGDAEVPASAYIDLAKVALSHM
jgi:hypothetical protein